MRFAPIALAATAMLASAAPIAAAPPRADTTVTVVMAHRHFHPQVIRLNRGQPYRILLVNRDDTGHNFDAKGFFGNAEIDSAGAGGQAVHEGLISVPAHATVAFRVTPTVARPFDLKSSVALDAASGMQGQILVY
jgi:Cupredoxin-like domain